MRDLQPLPPVAFAKNDVGFFARRCRHDALGVALKKALYN